MYDSPSLLTHILVGKIIGLIFGLFAFLFSAYIWPQSSWLVLCGVLLWYPTMGGIIGIAGIFTQHPVLKLPLPWWARSILIGAWMNLVLTLFTYDTMETILLSLFGVNTALASPFWFVVEGAVAGLFIGFWATKLAGVDINTNPKQI